jgi:hypothetical protein
MPQPLGLVAEPKQKPSPATEPAAVATRAPLLALVVSAGLAIGLGFFVVPIETGRAVIRLAGVWLMLATFAGFVCALALVSKRTWTPWWRDRREWVALAAIPAGGAILLRHEPFGFKIIMDEIMLLGTSMSLHLDKLVQVPLRGHDLQGAFVITEGMLDKRPYFFPFLLSLVHDATGYRPENAFLLNAVLALLLLVVAYVLGRTLAGRAGAVVGVLLLAGLPLLAQNATGGGFDLLNLLMIAVVLWLALRFAATREPIELVALSLAGVLLAQTRYESGLFVFAAGGLILWAWRQERRVILPWAVVFVPLLLLPVPWLLRGYADNSAAWELASQGQSQDPIAWSHFTGNLRHAAAFFFDRTGAQSNSLLFAVAGLAAVAGLIVRWVRKKNAGAAPGSQAALLAIGLGLAAHFALLMAYFWGRFDDPVITRLSLPVHLLFLLALWAAVPRGPAGRWIWRGLAVLAFFQIWSLSIPAMARHAYTVQNVHAQEVAWRRDYIAGRPARDFLVIDPYSIVWLTHRVPATTPAQTRAQPDAIAHHLRSRSFGDILVFQRCEVNGDTGAVRILPEFDLGPRFELEPLAERRVQPYAVARISRVKAVRP